MLRRWSRLLVVGMALILGAGCLSASDAGGRNNLPPAPSVTMSSSDYELDHPYRVKGDGIADRAVFDAPSNEGYSVVVRDLLVAPKKPETPVPIVTGAVFEVRQGAGEAKLVGGHDCEGKICEEKIILSPGTIFTMDAGKKLYITARDGPLALRTWIVSAGGES